MPWAEDGDKLMKTGGPEFPHPAAASNPMQTKANEFFPLERNESERNRNSARDKRKGVRKNGADNGTPLGNRNGVAGKTRLNTHFPRSCLDHSCHEGRRPVIYRATSGGNPVKTVVRDCRMGWRTGWRRSVFLPAGSLETGLGLPTAKDETSLARVWFQMRRGVLGKSSQTLTPQKCEPSVQIGVVIPARRWQGGPM
jgi:hypothetical protein